MFILIIDLVTGKKLTVKGYTLDGIIGEFEDSYADKAFRLSDENKTWKFTK